jgi:hypothetical protein
MIGRAADEVGAHGAGAENMLGLAQPAVVWPMNRPVHARLAEMTTERGKDAFAFLSNDPCADSLYPLEYSVDGAPAREHSRRLRSGLSAKQENGWRSARSGPIRIGVIGAKADADREKQPRIAARCDAEWRSLPRRKQNHVPAGSGESLQTGSHPRPL